MNPKSEGVGYSCEGQRGREKKEGKKIHLTSPYPHYRPYRPGQLVWELFLPYTDLSPTPSAPEETGAEVKGEGLGPCSHRQEWVSTKWVGGNGSLWPVTDLCWHRPCEPSPTTIVGHPPSVPTVICGMFPVPSRGVRFPVLTGPTLEDPRPSTRSVVGKYASKEERRYNTKNIRTTNRVSSPINKWSINTSMIVCSLWFRVELFISWPGFVWCWLRWDSRPWLMWWTGI